MAKRIDPVSRSVDGAINDIACYTQLDPNRVYVEANPNDFYCGVQEMKRQGWEIETYRKDGPRIVGGETAGDGSALTRYGNVLMSRTRASHEEYERRKQQVAADRSKAIGQKGGYDRVVGPTGQLAYHVESPEEYVERGKF